MRQHCGRQFVVVVHLEGQRCGLGWFKVKEGHYRRRWRGSSGTIIQRRYGGAMDRLMTSCLGQRGESNGEGEVEQGFQYLGDIFIS